MTMRNCEFWIATLSDDEGLHESEIMWGDGYTAKDALIEANSLLSVHRQFADEAMIEAHGPFTCNGGTADHARDVAGDMLALLREIATVTQDQDGDLILFANDDGTNPWAGRIASVIRRATCGDAIGETGNVVIAS